MGTRSRIGLQLADGSILSVYCHYDGYVSFNGVKLVEHFNSYELAAELIDGGDMSVCWNDNNEPEYYSARGEDFPPRHDTDLNEYLCNGEEYAYLFSNGEWICYDLHGDVHPDIVKEIPIPTAALAG
jgi:hypothetical protein